MHLYAKRDQNMIQELWAFSLTANGRTDSHSDYNADPIVANRPHASTYSPVAFRSVHTGIEPPFLLKVYYAITACMTQGFTFRKYWLKENW